MFHFLYYRNYSVKLTMERITRISQSWDNNDLLDFAENVLEWEEIHNDYIKNELNNLRNEYENSEKNIIDMSKKEIEDLQINILNHIATSPQESLFTWLVEMITHVVESESWEQKERENNRIESPSKIISKVQELDKENDFMEVTESYLWESDYVILRIPQIHYVKSKKFEDFLEWKKTNNRESWVGITEKIKDSIRKMELALEEYEDIKEILASIDDNYAIESFLENENYNKIKDFLEKLTRIQHTKLRAFTDMELKEKLREWVDYSEIYSLFYQFEDKKINSIKNNWDLKVFLNDKIFNHVSRPLSDLKSRKDMNSIWWIWEKWNQVWSVLSDILVTQKDILSIGKLMISEWVTNIAWMEWVYTTTEHKNWVKLANWKQIEELKYWEKDIFREYYKLIHGWLSYISLKNPKSIQAVWVEGKATNKRAVSFDSKKANAINLLRSNNRQYKKFLIDTIRDAIRFVQEIQSLKDSEEQLNQYKKLILFKDSDYIIDIEEIREWWIIESLEDENKRWEIIRNLEKKRDEIVLNQRNIDSLQNIESIMKDSWSNSIMINYWASHFDADKPNFQELCKEKKISYMIIKPKSLSQK